MRGETCHPNIHVASNNDMHKPPLGQQQERQYSGSTWLERRQLSLQSKAGAWMRLRPGLLAQSLQVEACSSGCHTHTQPRAGPRLKLEPASTHAYVRADQVCSSSSHHLQLDLPSTCTLCCELLHGKTTDSTAPYIKVPHQHPRCQPTQPSHAPHPPYPPALLQTVLG